MSISEVILFISTASRASIPCVNAVKQHQLRISIVKLDSEESRQKAASGKYFQIVGVPALVVIYDNGTIQLFLGGPKILEWMSNITAKSRPEPAPYRGVGVGPSPAQAGDNMYGPGRPANPMMKPPRYVDYGGDEEPQPEPEDIEEVPEDDEPVIIRKAPKKTPKSKSKQKVVEEDDDEEPGETPVPIVSAIKSPKSKSKKKGKKGVKFDINDEKAKAKAAPATEQPKKESQRMKNLFEAARQMEKDRTATLGYKEEDLPKYH